MVRFAVFLGFVGVLCCSGCGDSSGPATPTATVIPEPPKGFVGAGTGSSKKKETNAAPTTDQKME